jgi:hypothetical protein
MLGALFVLVTLLLPRGIVGTIKSLVLVERWRRMKQRGGRRCGARAKCRSQPSRGVST